MLWWQLGPEGTGGSAIALAMSLRRGELGILLLPGVDHLVSDVAVAQVVVEQPMTGA